MTTVRRVVAVAVVIAACWAFYLFCVLPYRCNVVKKAQLRSTAFAFDQATTLESRIAARQNVDAFLPCMTAICRDTSLDMLAAANYRILGQPETAIDLYHDALRRDQRPEIYLNLAMTELAIGQRNAARDHMLRAALFNVGILASVEDGLLRDETAKKLIELHPEKAEFIRYFQNFGATQ
jgi:tetratricopeptide (TPR) repeat protein